MTGIGATVGGVCGGPVGLVVGGLVGGSLAAWRRKIHINTTGSILDGYQQGAKASNVRVHEISDRRVQSAEFCWFERQSCHGSRVKEKIFGRFCCVT